MKRVILIFMFLTPIFGDVYIDSVFSGEHDIPFLTQDNIKLGKQIWIEPHLKRPGVYQSGDTIFYHVRILIRSSLKVDSANFESFTYFDKNMIEQGPFTLPDTNYISQQRSGLLSIEFKDTGGLSLSSLFNSYFIYTFDNSQPYEPTPVIIKTLKIFTDNKLNSYDLLGRNLNLNIINPGVLRLHR